MFAAVEFVDNLNPSCEVVPLNWINGKFCKWPRQRLNNLNKLLKNRTSPPTDWASHEIKIYKHFDAFEKAIHYCERLQYTSDASNSSDEENFGKGHRKKFKSQKLEYEPDKTSSPCRKRIIKPLQFPIPIDNTSLTLASETQISDETNIFSEYGQDIKQNEIIFETEEPFSIKEEPLICKEEPFINKEEPFISMEEPFISKEEPLISKEEPFISKPSQKNSFQEILEAVKDLSAKQSIMMKNLEMVRRDVKYMRIKFQDLEDFLKKKSETPHIELKKFYDKNEFDNFIASMEEDENKARSFKKSLSLIGGFSSTSAVKNILRYVMADEVAVKFCWTGAKGKCTFCTNKFNDFVKESLRSWSKITLTDNEYKVIVSEFLRKASDRIKQKKDKK